MTSINPDGYSNFPKSRPVGERHSSAEITRRDLAKRINKTIRETGRFRGTPPKTAAVPVWMRPAMDLFIDEYKDNYGEAPKKVWKGRSKTPKKETLINSRSPSVQHFHSSEQGGSNRLSNVTILKQGDNSRLGAGQSNQDFLNRDLTNPDVAQGKAFGVYPWIDTGNQPSYVYKVGAGQIVSDIRDYADTNFKDNKTKEAFVEKATEYYKLLKNTGEDVRLTYDDFKAIKSSLGIENTPEQTRSLLSETGKIVEKYRISPNPMIRDMPSEAGRTLGISGRIPMQTGFPGFGPMEAYLSLLSGIPVTKFNN